MLSVADAAAEADLVMVLLPDTEQAAVYEAEIAPHLAAGDALFFAHGFNIRFDLITPPPTSTWRWSPRRGRATWCGAPTPRAAACRRSSPWPRTRRARPTTSPSPTPTRIGGTRAGVLDTTFAEETETDLFGEQVVLCGGLTALVQAGFETLVDAGYQPESAYFECLHELKLIVDLMYEQGIAGMRYSISDTAEYGDLTRGPG